MIEQNEIHKTSKRKHCKFGKTFLDTVIKKHDHVFISYTADERQS